MDGQIISFFLGMLTNFLVWYLLFHGLVPKINFSKFISKTPISNLEGKSTFAYRIKLENAGRRNIIDLDIFARLKIKGLDESRPNNWHVVNIPLSSNGKNYRIPRMLTTKKGHARRPTVRILVNNTKDFMSNTLYPSEIRKKAKQENLTLEEVLKLGTKTTFEIHVFGYDEFSGTRKLFVSNSYQVSDIKSGTFNPNNLEMQFQVNEPL